MFDSKVAALGITDTFDIAGARVGIEADDSLETLARRVNTLSRNTGVTAAVLTTGSGAHQLILAAPDAQEPVATLVEGGRNLFQRLSLQDGAEQEQAPEPLESALNGRRAELNLRFRMLTDATTTALEDLRWLEARLRDLQRDEENQAGQQGSACRERGGGEGSPQRGGDGLAEACARYERSIREQVRSLRRDGIEALPWAGGARNELQRVIEKQSQGRVSEAERSAVAGAIRSCILAAIDLRQRLDELRQANETNARLLTRWHSALITNARRLGGANTGTPT